MKIDQPISDSSSTQDVEEQIQESKAPSRPDQIPNGGLQAWLQVLGNFFLFFNAWGIINSYGSFQTYYETVLLPNESPSNLSWVGSIQTFCLLVVGAIAGRWVDAGYFRTVIAVGSFLMVFGMMMTSLAKEYYQIVLAQGLVVGLGSGLLFLPGAAVVSTWFSTKRAFAVGISASGSSLGGIIFPILVRQLIPKVGFPWAVRTMAFIMLAGLMVSLSVMRQRTPPRKAGPLVDLAAFKEPAYNLFVWGEALGYMGLWTPFFFIGGFALKHDVDENMAFYLLSIINAASIFGRIVPNYFADKIGPLNMLVPCAIVTSIMIFAWIRIVNLAGLVVFAIIFGFFSGAFVSLPPACLASLTPDLSRMGVRMGMAFTIAAFSLLCGPPISGAIISATGYWGAQVFAGVVVLVGAGIMGSARLQNTGWKLVAKG